MRYTSRWTLGAAVSAALLLVATATSHAQPAAPGASPIVTGGGKWLTMEDGVVVGTVFSAVSVVELPDGTISGQGSGEFKSVDGGVMGVGFDVVDIQPAGDELFVISRITQTQNAPDIEIGSWALLGVQDNGSGQGSPSDRVISSTGQIPSFVPLEAIKQILMLPPPDGPPAPDMWFPLTGGNFTIH